MSDEVLIEELRTAMRAEVENIEVAPGVLGPVLATPPRPRVGLGWLIPALGVAVAGIVAVVAVTSLSHHSAGTQGASSRAPSAARGLVSQLGVLRRPQTAADVLPRWAVRETESLTHTAGVIGGLSRLVGAVHMGQYGRARVYLVVQRPPHFPLHLNHLEPPFLKPSLGDQATIAFVGPFREEAAINGPTVAAGGETVAATGHGLTADPGQFSDLWGAVAAIVPDGVARVKWVFGTETRASKHITVWARVRDNVALGRIPARLQIYMSSAVWYGADGRVISSFPSSPSPSAQTHQFKHALQASLHQRVAPVLVRHFAVLSSVHASGYPGLDHAQETSLIEPNPLGLNTRGERFVVDTPGAAKAFVVPGTQGIALLVTQPVRAQLEGGVAGALSGSLFTERGLSSRTRIIIGLAPNGNRTVTVLLRGGGSRTARVVNNVYSIVVPASGRTMILKSASGRTVHLHLAFRR